MFKLIVMNKTLLYTVILLLIAGIYNCQYPVDNSSLPELKKFIVIDAKLTEKYGKVLVNYTLTGVTSQGDYETPVPPDATAYVVDSHGNRTDFATDGTADSTFHGIIGETYQLHVEADGKTYESKAETMPACPELDSLFAVYSRETSRDPDDLLYDGFDVYAQFADIPGQENYYQWDWVHYGRRASCAIVVENGQEVLVPCTPYDCWGITYNDRVIVQSDNLRDGQAWENLPDATPGQGQPLVAHGEFIYRTGGMAARNAADEKENLHSLDLVQRFNPHSRQWENLPSLPATRSSHDAVIVADKLYLFGGWQLTGSTKEAIWPTNALVLDLQNPSGGWKEFPQPFQRRALAVATVGSRIYIIGGMDSNNKPTLAVDIYDTATGQWTKGPDLPPGEHEGFSCSAIAQNGRIYANAFQGDLLRLSMDERSWEVVGRLEHPRMAHRLVTAGTTQLIALGGEDGEDKRPDLELLTPAVNPLVKQSADTTQAAAHIHQ